MHKYIKHKYSQYTVYVATPGPIDILTTFLKDVWLPHTIYSTDFLCVFSSSLQLKYVNTFWPRCKKIKPHLVSHLVC